VSDCLPQLTHEINMPNITAILIDSREPDSVKNLKFGGLPTMVTFLETGDIRAVTDDLHTILVERKTPEDFLDSLKDGRLFVQLGRMAQERYDQQLSGSPITSWPYLVVTEPFTVDKNGKVVTDRGVTGWAYSSAMGAILSIQEMGVFVVFAGGASDYENCILRIGRRDRTSVKNLLPARPANILGPKATFLASLPGIGIERVQDILAWCDNNVGHALIGLTDLTINAPIGVGMRRNIKNMLGLEEHQSLELVEKEISANG